MNSFIFMMIFMQVSIFFIGAILLASTGYLLLKKHFQKAEVEKSLRSVSRIHNRALAN